jgi:amino acid permease
MGEDINNVETNGSVLVEEQAASMEPISSASSDPNNEGHDGAQIEPGTPSLVSEASDDSNGAEERMGTVSSARFNMLSTMVGGGSLSLPLAFQRSGNALLGPFLLLLTAAITEFCFRVLVSSARMLSPVPPDHKIPGTQSFESVSAAAFGPKSYLFSQALVMAMCFFGSVGYAVLLRDMLEPVTDLVFPSHQKGASGPSWDNNLTMLTVCLLVTPLCTLKTLTALERFGAASMFSVLILGVCILFRSLQCTTGVIDHTPGHWYDGFQLLPHTWKDVLDVIPLYISCYVCHYNLVPVHNELQRPSEERVRFWLKSTVWYSTAFYLVLGIAGSAYGRCTDSGAIHGNVLLDFDETDPLIMVGRMCLAVTITLAFPMLTIPPRDILIRSLPDNWSGKGSSRRSGTSRTERSQAERFEDAQEQLCEPLLEGDEEQQQQSTEEVGGTDTDEGTHASFAVRFAAAIVCFWTAAAVASCVSSIDIVWDLLGSSLSIILSYLIPCGCFLLISQQQAQAVEQDEAAEELRGEGRREKLARAVAWGLILFFTPLMFVSTANAVFDTFFNR